jgi:hypothetical protein
VIGLDELQKPLFNESEVCVMRLPKDSSACDGRFQIVTGYHQPEIRFPPEFLPKIAKLQIAFDRLK